MLTNPPDGFLDDLGGLTSPHEGRRVGLPSRGEPLSERGAPPSPVMTVDDVAAWLHTSRAAIYKMVERGQLPGVRRLGRKLYFHRASLVDWLDQNRASSLTGGQ